MFWCCATIDIGFPIPKLVFFIDSQARICEILITDPMSRHFESKDFSWFFLYDLLRRLWEGLRNFSGRRNFYGNGFFGKIWNRIVKFILTHSELVSISGTKK